MPFTKFTNLDFDQIRTSIKDYLRANSTFTDFDFKNNGLDSVFKDMGRYNITLNDADKGKFKTPTLRNIELTAPYMHDGRFTTLEQVIDHYNSNFIVTPTTDVNIALSLKSDAIPAIIGRFVLSRFPPQPTTVINCSFLVRISLIVFNTLSNASGVCA